MITRPMMITERCRATMPRRHRASDPAQPGVFANLSQRAEYPQVLADLTGISISTAERWSQWAKRDWAVYVGQRVADDREGARPP